MARWRHQGSITETPEQLFFQLIEKTGAADEVFFERIGENETDSEG